MRLLPFLKFPFQAQVFLFVSAVHEFLFAGQLLALF